MQCGPNKILVCQYCFEQPRQNQCKSFCILLHQRVWVKMVVQWGLFAAFLAGMEGWSLFGIFCSMSSSVLDIWFLGTLLLYITEDNDTANLVTEPDKIVCLFVVILILQLFIAIRIHFLNVRLAFYRISEAACLLAYCFFQCLVRASDYAMYVCRAALDLAFILQLTSARPQSVQLKWTVVS